MQDLESTIIAQYANSPTLLRLIHNMNAYVDPSANIDAFYNLMWDVDTAVGYGLDVWGRIVGVSRVLQVVDVAYFGFTGPPGVSGLPWNQGIFYHGQPLNSNVTLGDDQFRILILAKALKNICNSSIQATNQILINIFGPGGLLPMEGNSYCTDGQDMSMTYTFSSPLGPLGTSIVYNSGVVPRPAGVLLNIVEPSTDFWNDLPGWLVLFFVSGYPTSPAGLIDGAVWSNGLAVAVVPGVSPDPLAPPIYFGEVNAVGLQVLGGGDLPLSNPGVLNQLWNDAGQIAVSSGP